MKAFVVTPRLEDSGRLTGVPEPSRTASQALVQVLAVGVDGTDRELLYGEYEEAPPGDDYLIIGHESLGRVLESPAGGPRPGDPVVAIVRRPDPKPCVNCAAGEGDMCLSGRYTERGIKGAHGFLAERYTEDSRYLVTLPEQLARTSMLLEPLTIVEKAIEQIKRAQSRLVWVPRSAAVLGAGSIGTLATLLLRLESLHVYLYSRGDGGTGRQVAEAAGDTFISADRQKLDHALAKEIGPIDVVIEATGYSPLAFEAMNVGGPNGVVCLTGVSGSSRSLTIDASHLNLEMVLENKLVFGTVNANHRHFESGVTHMQAFEGRWPGPLKRMVTRRVPFARFGAGELEHPSDLRVVADVAA